MERMILNWEMDKMQVKKVAMLRALPDIMKVLVETMTYFDMPSANALTLLVFR
jgi:hypothetical protein